MRLLVLLILAVVIIGCGKADKNEATGSNQPKNSTSSSLAKDAIEGLTGKTAVMQGEQAKEKIKTISADENKNLNEVLNNK